MQLHEGVPLKEMLKITLKEPGLTESSSHSSGPWEVFDRVVGREEP